ncbi:MAG: alpha/beta hydrolase [Alphaproteobacteria bacterium]|nr:alpha/beta hydrolase [Alphaproteobacteria bacterium]
MAEVIINGSEGRIEGRYYRGARADAPVALILHSETLDGADSSHGGTMNNKVTYTMFHAFQHMGFSVLRFNFRGVGKSQGVFDGGAGELADATSALDWLQDTNKEASSCWVAGYSFGAWISMQLLMRRPEIDGFVSIAPPTNTRDFSFLAPCPSSGLILQGASDEVVTEEAVSQLAEKLSLQKNISINYQVLPNVDHYFTNHLKDVHTRISTYVKAFKG